MAKLQHMRLICHPLPINPGTAAGLGQLTALLSLHLVGNAVVQPCVLDPEVLQPLTQLTNLQLDAVRLAPRDAAALLQLLSDLQELLTLELTSINCDWPSLTADYSALLASTNLQEMKMENCLMPAMAWSKVFLPQPSAPWGAEPTTIRPQLQRLYVNWTQSGWHMNEGRQPEGVMRSEEVCHIAKCCPQLEFLSMYLQVGAELRKLSRLTRLTALEVVGGRPESIQMLAALKGLQNLTPTSCAASAVEREWLQPLTALRKLHDLNCIPNGYHGLLSEYRNHAAAGSPPDVWRQILEDCVRLPQCHPNLLRDLTLQVEQQEQALEQLRQDMQQSGARQQEERLAALEQGLAQQRAETAELRGQLQQLLEMMRQAEVE